MIKTNSQIDNFLELGVDLLGQCFIIALFSSEIDCGGLSFCLST